MKGFGGMQQFIKQANQMQNKMKKRQEELNEKTYEAQSGGGAVQVTVNGKYQMEGIQIQEEVLKSQDQDMLQDLILTATNQALKDAKETTEKEMEKITGSIGLPGMF